MPCFFMRMNVKRLLERLKIKNKEKLNQKLRERFSDKELHEMSEEQLLYWIKKIHEEYEEELSEDAIMMYA